MVNYGKVVEISEGGYPEDRQDALFMCPTDTDIEDVGRAINNSIADNKGIWSTNPTYAEDGETQSDKVMDEFGCSRIRSDDVIHVSNSSRTRTKSRWNEEKQEMEHKELRKPKLLINGNSFTEGGEQW